MTVVAMGAMCSEATLIVPVDMTRTPARILLPAGEGATVFGWNATPEGARPNERRANASATAALLLPQLLPDRGGKPVGRCHMVTW